MLYLWQGHTLMDPKLISCLASVKDDPLAFVLGAFPWSEEGALAEFDGPLAWQREILEKIRLGLLNPAAAVQLATAPGHAIGTSPLVPCLTLLPFIPHLTTRI